MSTSTTYETHDTGAAGPLGPDLPEDVVEVRRDGPLSAVVAVLAGAVAVLYLVRAVGGGSALDWVLALAIGAVAVAHAAILLDSRAPLMVLDAHGVRTRRGRVWEGIAWSQVSRVEHTPRSSMLRDGRLEFTDVDGRALAVRLSMSTRLAGANWHELTDALVELADGHTHVVERAEDDEVAAAEDQEPTDQPVDETIDETTDETVGTGDEPVRDEPHDEVTARDDVFDQEADEPADEAAVPRVSPSPAATCTDTDATTTFGIVDVRPVADDEPQDPVDDAPAEEPTPAPDLARAPAPLRDLVTARRTEVLLDRPDSPAVAVTPGAGTPLDERAVAAYSREVPDAPRSGATAPGSETTTIVFDDAMTARVEPVADPVIGDELAAARTRLGLGVDQLAARTRIRPHVIEAIEVDDFGPCGGDFYARGHLRTLGRVLGIDPEPLVATYEERYSDAPIDPKRVFSSELAAAPGGSLRSTRGGFNWSVIVACVMAVVLVWSVARLLMDGPVPLADQPVLDGTPDRASLSGAPTTVPVTLTAARGGASVIVRDGSRNTKIVFKDDLAFGQTAELDVVPPVRIRSSDGGLEVSVDGQDEGALGTTGEAAEQIFVPED